MNRVLKRPMFRIGGSAGSGITSGLDQPQKMAKGGRIGYQQGTTPNFQMSGLPGFLTSFGLNLLATPPQGNIFQTAATAAIDPFNRLQMSQARSKEIEGERAFKRQLQQELLEGQKELKGMEEDNEALLEKYDGNQIKAQREKNFYDTGFASLQTEYGQEGVSTEVIDSSDYVKKGSLKKLVKSRPELTRQVIYDVAKGKAMRLVKNALTGDFELVPADSADIDTTGDQQPSPRKNPGLFGQPTKPNIVGPAIEKLGEEFSDDFYQGT
jgi:Skp family chaperone for outer membrane proteins